MDTSETSGNRIKRLREEHSYSLEELAEKADISVNSLAGIESGAVRTFGPFLDNIANALSVTSYYIQSGCESQDEISIFSAMQFDNHSHRQMFEEYARAASFRHKNLTQKELHVLKSEFIRNKI